MPTGVPERLSRRNAETAQLLRFQSDNPARGQEPGLEALEGQTVTEIAKARGTDEVDAFLDVTLEDDVDNEFIFTSFNTEIGSMTRILNHPHVLIGLGDGGAHVDMLCDAGYPTFLLGNGCGSARR